MILSQFVSNIEKGVLENYGTIMTDQSQIIFTVSNMLTYLYNYRVWRWAITRQTIVPSNSICTLANESIHVIKVLNGEQEYKAHPIPFTPTDPGIQGFKKYFHNKNTVTLSDTVTSVDIRYIKTPTRLTESNLSEEIDLPDSYIGILYFLCMRALRPYNLENGASLANNFKTSFVDELIGRFEGMHSLGISPTNVQWASFFNGK